MTLFAVDCPGYGTEKANLSTTATTIGVHCSCGVTFSVDVDAQAVDEWRERESRSYVETRKARIITLSRR